MWVAALAFVFASTGWAQTFYDDESTPEGWAWALIRKDQPADFDNREGCKEWDPRVETEDPCRQISPQFIVDVLTVPKLRDQLPLHGFRLHGAIIKGNIDLADAEVTREVRIEVSRIEGDLVLTESHWSHPLSLGNSTLTKNLYAERMRTESDVRLAAMNVGEVDLMDAKVGANLWMSDSIFMGGVNANSLNVRSGVLMDRAEFYDTLDLTIAKAGGVFNLSGAIATRIDFPEGTARELMLENLHWRCLTANARTAAASGSATNPKPLSWSLRNPTSQETTCGSPSRTTMPTLVLRNAHFDTFQDSDDAWPLVLDLEGFHYDRLGGIGGEGRDDMRNRPPEQWIRWLERDPTFSPQPYAQLSSVLVAAGRRDVAEAVQFAGREKERQETWNGPAPTLGHGRG
jgi:hypothetical protein